MNKPKITVALDEEQEQHTLEIEATKPRMQ